MPMRPARFCSRCHRTAVAGGRLCALHGIMPDSGHGARSPLEKLYNCVKWRPRLQLGKKGEEDWEFCFACKKPLPLGRRDVASEKKAARETVDRYTEVRQNTLAQRKKD
jgi:hypothetical protein